MTLFHGHIPDNEAEINAENNYMWPEAVEVAKAHKAHIIVAVLGEEEKLLERGKLFTKAMAVCCKQKYATGVYTSGVVFEPRFYEGFADMMKEDELPIFNWIWFGLYRSEGGLNGYTYGMDVFGKEEMEVLNTDAEPEELRDFLASLASYVLACDVTLQDGETIGFSADDKHTITRSPGVSLPEEQMTLKIGYEPIKGDPEDDSCDHSDNEDTQNEEEFSNPEVYTEEERRPSRDTSSSISASLRMYSTRSFPRNPCGHCRCRMRRVMECMGWTTLPIILRALRRRNCLLTPSMLITSLPFTCAGAWSMT